MKRYRKAYHRDTSHLPRGTTNSCGLVAYPTRTDARKDAKGPLHDHRARECRRCNLWHLHAPSEVARG